MQPKAFHYCRIYFTVTLAPFHLLPKKSVVLRPYDYRKIPGLDCRIPANFSLPRPTHSTRQGFIGHFECRLKADRNLRFAPIPP